VRVVRWLHRYLGVVVSVFLVITGLTGAVLVHADALWRWQLPELAAPRAAPEPGADAPVLADLLDSHAPRLVKWPRPGFNGWQLWLEDGSRAIAAGDGEILWHGHWWQSPVDFMHELHAHLLAGHTGELILGWIALFSVVLLALGVAAWWPARHRFRLGRLWPRSARRGTLIQVHRDWGVLIAPLLLVVLATGAGLVFYTQARAGLNALLSPHPPTPAPGTPPGAEASSTAPLNAERIETALRAAASTLPEAEPVFAYPPTQDNRLLRVRMRHPGEIHPNGRSFVFIDPRKGQIHGVIDARREPLGERATHAIYALHAGRIGQPVYAGLTTVTGLLLAALGITGIWAYAKTFARNR